MSVVDEVKSTFRGIIGDVTGVMSIVIAIAVFTLIMPMLIQLTGFMKSFQSYIYKQPSTTSSTTTTK